MVSGEHSDSFLQVAVMVGYACSVLTLLIIVIIIFYRVVYFLQEQRVNQLEKIWKPIFIEAILGGSIHYPALAPSALMDYLYLWLHFQESVKQQARAPLNRMLREQHLLLPIHKKLLSGRLSEQIIAAAVLGHAGYMEAWNDLSKLSQKATPELSIVSARAQMLMDPASAGKNLIPLIIKRRDWSYGRLSSMLKEVDPSFANEFMNEVHKASFFDADYLVRLLRLVENMQHNQHMPFLTQILQQNQNPEVIAACLRILNDPTYLEKITAHIDNPSIGVRVQLANAYKRFGSHRYKPQLLKLMASREWWVRYRSAQALVSGPYIQQADYEGALAKLDDEFARDIFKHTIAEKAIV